MDTAIIIVVVIFIFIDLNVNGPSAIQENSLLLFIRIRSSSRNSGRVNSKYMLCVEKIKSFSAKHI